MPKVWVPKPPQCWKAWRPAGTRAWNDSPDPSRTETETPTGATMKTRLLSLMILCAAGAMTTAVAAPVAYNVDPDHTHVQFDTDHFGGLSVWRGIMVKNRGTLSVDKAAGSG